MAFGTCFDTASDAMDVILKVLEGAKVGVKVAVKKNEFSIGRSPKCELCAGSSSISRQHCMLIRHEASISIKDLGSRNGTLINDKKIDKDQEVELNTGDEISIGSLRFLVTITHGIKNRKRSQIKSVAEAVDRAVESSSEVIVEDDISNWLIDEPGTTRQAVTKTQTIRMDDTNAVDLSKASEEDAENPDEFVDPDVVDSTETKGEKKKKEPGKLPPIPEKNSPKDSRDAAMQALRNWNRRR